MPLLDQLHELLVKVDQQPPAFRVSHQQRCVQPDTLLLNALEPRLVPQRLKLNKRLGHLKA